MPTGRLTINDSYCLASDYKSAFIQPVSIPQPNRFSLLSTSSYRRFYFFSTLVSSPAPTRSRLLRGRKATS